MHQQHPYPHPPQQPGQTPHDGSQPQAHPGWQQQGWPQQQQQGWQQQQQQQGWPQQQQQGWPQQQQQQGWPQQQQGWQQQQQQQQGWPQQQQQQQQQGWPQQQQVDPQHAGGWQGHPQSHGVPAGQAWPQPPVAPVQPHWQPGNAAVPVSYEAHDPDLVAANASPEVRAKFIERTYLHLALAMAAFVLLEAIAVNLPGIEKLVEVMVSSRASWGVVLVLFMGASWIADKWSRNATSLAMQYAGLAIYVLAEVIIFIPMIHIARMFIGSQGILMAGGVTLAMFAAMTAYVFISKKDFSFLKGTLSVLTAGALCLVIGSLVFGFHLGMVFSVGMIALASGYILFYTSNVLRHYRVTQHVAAALALFSAVALLFWYVLRLLMERR